MSPHRGDIGRRWRAAVLAGGLIGAAMTIAVGVAPAAAAAKARRQHMVTRVVASPYTRTLETAEIVAGVLGLAVTVESAIGERVVFDCDIGTERSVLTQTWPDWSFHHLDEEWWPTREESEDSLERRCRGFRDDMSRTDAWRGVLVVTHWGVIRTLTGHRVQNADLVKFDPTAPHPGGGTVVSTPDTC